MPNSLTPLLYPKKLLIVLCAISLGITHIQTQEHTAPHTAFLENQFMETLKSSAGVSDLDRIRDYLVKGVNINLQQDTITPLMLTIHGLAINTLFFDEPTQTLDFLKASTLFPAIAHFIFSGNAGANPPPGTCTLLIMLGFSIAADIKNPHIEKVGGTAILALAAGYLLLNEPNPFSRSFVSSTLIGYGFFHAIMLLAALHRKREVQNNPRLFYRLPIIELFLQHPEINLGMTDKDGRTALDIVHYYLREYPDSTCLQITMKEVEKLMAKSTSN